MRRRSVWEIDIADGWAVLALWGGTFGHKELYDELDTPAARAFCAMRRVRIFHDAWKHACHADRAFDRRITYMRARNACMGVSR